ncbi:hypothetical protein [Mycobacterium sp. NAZ190054]|uniref:hypothetical protein n=1 Tax=Mycobacterium sp. NAZ190054 TaxID=1747766 RepID=UPI0007981003|nr:hypothetical protein [Mycobacterium sp. NAZ190054]KWX61469.1 hypothetical protein ASJ79_29710 [Mycobacterium sp. NAZ190054]
MAQEQWPAGERPDTEARNDAGTSTDTLKIDCDDCAVRGPGCQDCVVSVLLGVPETLHVDERRALEVLAEVGLAPRLRLVPIHRPGRSGVA